MNEKEATQMYNEELKNKFFESERLSESLKTKYKSIFNRTSKWECKYEKDLCLIDDIKLLQEIFNDISGVSYRTSYATKSTLKRYFEWCVESGVKGAVNLIGSIEIKNVDDFKNTMVQDPLHLQRFLNDIFDSEEENTIDNTYRCLFWLAYAGISSDDAVRIKTNDVDFVTMSVKYNNESYPIYKEGIKCFRKCVELKEFNFIHARYESVLDRYNSSQLLRGIRGDMVYITSQSRISRRVTAKNTGTKLSYEKSRMSGFFYRMYEEEVYGIKLDFKVIAEEYMSGREYHLKDKHSTQRVRNTIAKSFEEDYSKWKTAFNL